MRKLNFISSLLKSKRINIDDFDDFENLEIIADKQAYIKFYSDYVCLKNNLTNSEIISEKLMKKI